MKSVFLLEILEYHYKYRNSIKNFQIELGHCLKVLVYRSTSLKNPPCFWHTIELETMITILALLGKLSCQHTFEHMLLKPHSFGHMLQSKPSMGIRVSERMVVLPYGYLTCSSLGSTFRLKCLYLRGIKSKRMQSQGLNASKDSQAHSLDPLSCFVRFMYFFSAIWAN